MKTMRRFVILGIAVFVIIAGAVTAFADSRDATPAEAHKNYGAIANEVGRLEEFKSEMLEIKKEKLAGQVTDGTMTQEQADAILAKIETKQANCDGTGHGMDGGGFRMGAKFGQDDSQDRGQGNGPGRGQGGHGIGRGLRNGSCLNP